MKNAGWTFALIAASMAASLSARAADLDYRPLDVYGSPDPAPRSANYPTVIGHRGVPSWGPNCGVVAYASAAGSIWLGHFTGGNIGRLGPVREGVDWRDAYACFPSRRDCQAWQRDMRHTFRRLEGYRTCLPIR
jgi:hypothetical protein